MSITRNILTLAAGASLVLTFPIDVSARSEISEFRTIVDRLQRQTSENLTEMDLLYWPDLLEKFPDFRYLTYNADKFKNSALDILFENSSEWENSVNPVPFKDRETLIVGSMYGLSPNDYLDFLNGLVTRVELGKGTFRGDLLVAAITPRHDLTGLLVFNYEDPRVQQILLRIKERLNTDQGNFGLYSSQIIDVIDGVLSGRSASLANRSRKRYPKEYPNNLVIPRVGKFESSQGSAVGPINPADSGVIERSSVKLGAEGNRPSRYFLYSVFGIIVVIAIGCVRKRKKG